MSHVLGAEMSSQEKYSDWSSQYRSGIREPEQNSGQLRCLVKSQSCARSCGTAAVPLVFVTSQQVQTIKDIYLGTFTKFIFDDT